MPFLTAFRVLFLNVANGLIRPERLKHVLEKSQADLRKVLSVRQEAAASLMGLL